MLNSEAIEYVKKPTEEFIRDSWRLVKRCTKPDRQGARMQSRGASTPAEAEAIQRSSQQAGRFSEQATSSQRQLAIVCGGGSSTPANSPRVCHAWVQQQRPARFCLLSSSQRTGRRRLPSLCGSLSSLRLSRACRRVLEDCTGDYDWLRDHGLHRLFREAHLYPDQQHRTLRTIAAHAACIAWRACCRLTHFMSHPCVRRLLACHKSVALLRGWSWRC